MPFLNASLLLTLALSFVPPALANTSAIQQSSNNDAQPRVTMDTTLGKIVLQLNAKKAPVTVANFLRYVDDGFYDGTIFHRVIDGFMIQGGGYTANLNRKKTNAPIKNEAINGLKNRRYTIAMARTNNPHSATAQFFINIEDNHNLDHTSPTPTGWGYTVFGEAIEGMDVIDDISTTEVQASGAAFRHLPVENILINEVILIATPAANPKGSEE